MMDSDLLFPPGAISSRPPPPPPPLRCSLTHITIAQSEAANPCQLLSGILVKPAQAIGPIHCVRAVWSVSMLHVGDRYRKKGPIRHMQSARLWSGVVSLLFILGQSAVKVQYLS